MVRVFDVASIRGRYIRSTTERLYTWTKDYLPQVVLADSDCAVVGAFAAVQVGLASTVAATHLTFNLALPGISLAAILRHMSLVESRPALPDEVAQYADRVRRRLVVRPGVAGVWRVNGRSDLSLEELVCPDLRYSETGRSHSIFRRCGRRCPWR